LSDVPVAEEIKKGIQKTAARLQEKGYSCTNVNLDHIDLKRARECWGEITFSISMARVPSPLKFLIRALMKMPVKSTLQGVLKIEEDRISVIREIE
jgi:hypothetical protein